MAELVAKTYAQALFEVATENQQIDQYGEELFFVLDTFRTYDEFYKIYKTPQIGKEEKKSIIQNVFSGRISTEIMNFLKVLVDKRRTSAFEKIAKEYKKLENGFKNILEGVVVTAVPLNESDRVSIESKISKMTGKTVKLKNEIDASIIGGILVNVGDKVIDATIKNRLDELEKDLAQIIV